jgi:hypothetical protein
MSDENLQGVKAAADAATDALKKLSDALGETGRGFDGAGDKADDASGKASRFGSVIHGTAERLRDFRDMLGTVRDLATGFGELAASGERQAAALARLGSAYELVRAATNDTVSAEQALHAQQSLVQSGLRVSNQELAAITRAARDYALATGTDATQALDQLVDALRGGEADGLRRFNISVQQGADRTRVFHGATQQLANAQRAAAAPARTLAEENDRFKRSLDEAVGSLTLAIAKAINFREALQMAAEAAGWVGGAIERLNGWARGGFATTNQRGVRMPGAATQPTPPATQGAMVDVTAGEGAGSDSAPAPARSSGGGRSRPPPINYAAIEKAKNAALSQELSESVRLKAEADRAIAEMEFAALRRAEQIAREGARLKQEQAKADAELARQSEEAARKSKAEAAFAEEKRAALERYVDTAKLTADITRTATDQMRTAVVESLGKVTNAMQDTVVALLEGEQISERVLKAKLHAVAVNLAAEAGIRAVMETANGIAKLAFSYGSDTTAYTHLTAAAVYASIAATAGVAAVATRDWKQGSASAGGASASGGGREPARAGGSSGSNDAPAPIVINYYGAVLATSEEMNDMMARGVNEANRRGSVSTSGMRRANA